MLRLKQDSLKGSWHLIYTLVTVKMLTNKAEKCAFQIEVKS